MIRAMLSESLQAVISQTLCKKKDGQGRVAAHEIMLGTSAIRNLVREGKTHQIHSAMQSGARHGMHTLDQHLAELVRSHTITYDTGREKCINVEDFNRLVGKTEGGS